MSEFPNLAKIGIVIALLGVLAIAVPVFTTHQTKEVAKVGDLKLTANEENNYVVPPLAGPVAVGLGVVLIAFGFIGNRKRI